MVQHYLFDDATSRLFVPRYFEASVVVSLNHPNPIPGIKRLTQGYSRLRAAVDAVATPRHETAFRVLDLHRSHAHRAERCERSRVRARVLAATLAEIVAELDPTPGDHR